MGEDLSQWIGKQEQVSGVLEPARSNALCAVLGNTAAAANGAPLPLLHHWLYFWNIQPSDKLGMDGHPTKGGFLPPVPLPRRMWAGGRLQFLEPLHIGQSVTKTTTILNVQAKSGKSGDLVFVTLRHELANEAGLAIVEEQDLVYRDAAAPGSVSLPIAGVPPSPCAWREAILPDPVLLFRYSALTMNGHRIHYDRPYAMDVEAYPGIVVHGPLMATLLVNLAARNLAGAIKTFDFRGNAPAFDGIPLQICGNPEETGATLWTEQYGTRNLVATVTC